MSKVVIAYIPALHRGYLDFFKKNPEQLFILGSDFVLEYPRMERDIRALTADEIQRALKSFVLIEPKILTKKTLNQLDSVTEVVMPDEDISRQFAEQYLQGKMVNYISTFLRWDGHNAQKKDTPVNPDRVISTLELDQEIMKQAFAEANKSSDWWRQIGAIVLKEGKIILIGHNRPLPSEGIHNIFGDPRSNFDYGVSFELSKFIHAEAGVIAEAAKRGISLEGSSIYVTTFPCPVCGKSVALAGIKKVYYTEGYALLDAEDILKTFGVEIVLVKLN